MASKEETWLKLYRSLLNWEWYNDNNVKILFLHLLLIVNIEPQRKRGVLVPAGSIDRTLEQLAAETGLTMRQVRTALDKLKTTKELTVKRHSCFSVFTIVNWSFFQGKRQKNVTLSDSGATKERQKDDNLNKNNRNIEYKEYSSDELGWDDLPVLTADEAQKWEKEHNKQWEGIIQW